MKIRLAELPELARGVLKKLPGRADRSSLLFLEGELGAGKTAFMQEIARELGIEETLQSPTFVLMKTYPIEQGAFTKLVHIDAYRLESPQEFRTLHPESFLNDPHALVCVEWPERAGGALPPPDVVLQFSHTDLPDAREVEIC